MSVFGVIVNIGALSAALLSMIGLLTVVWKLYRAGKKMSDKITKTYNSVGQINGDGRTIAENVKDTRKMAQAALLKHDEFAIWRGDVDHKLDHFDKTLEAQNRTLELQNRTLAEIKAQGR